MAEAIKAYEQVLALDDGNDETIAFLKSNYEKQRDWEKLIAVNQREVARIADAKTRSLRFVEIAKLASEKLRSRRFRSGCGSASEAAPKHAGAVGTRSCTSAKKSGINSPTSAKSRRSCSRTTPESRDAQKLGVLFTDRVRMHRGRRRRGVSCSRSSRKTGVPRMRSKKLFIEQKSWDDLEQFSPNRTSTTADPRLRASSRDGGRCQQGHPLEPDRGFVPRQDGQSGSRDACLREGAGARCPQPQAAEALIPLYEHAKDRKKLAGVLEIQLSHTGTSMFASSGFATWRSSSRTRSKQGARRTPGI